MKIALFITLISAQMAWSQAGTIDFDFGYYGKVVTQIDGYLAEAVTSAVQSDGKIILAGHGHNLEFTEGDIIIVRYFIDGTVDSTFATDGVFILNLDEEIDYCYDIEIDDSDRILFVGDYRNSIQDRIGYVGRLEKDGALDLSFGGAGLWRSPSQNVREEFNSISLLPNGKIIITGYTSVVFQDVECTIVRLNQNGLIDTSFGENGFAKDSNNGSCSASYGGVDNQGNIFIGGNPVFNASFLAKFNSEGELDENFGNDGFIIEDSNLNESSSDIIFQPDGKILIPVESRLEFGKDLGAVRFTAQGELDVSFGLNGRAIHQMNDQTNFVGGIALQEDGKIIFAGSGNNNYQFGRIDSNGQLDPTFSGDGVAWTDFSMNDFLKDAIILPNGKLLLSGFSRENNEKSFSMAQYFLDEVSQTTNHTLTTIHIQISPNPSNGSFKLSLNLESDTEFKIDLYSIDGKHLQEIAAPQLFQQGEHNIQINLSEITRSGMYLLRIGNEEQESFQKLVISK